MPDLLAKFSIINACPNREHPNLEHLEQFTLSFYKCLLARVRLLQGFWGNYSHFLLAFPKGNVNLNELIKYV